MGITMHLASLSLEPWICFGDFNEILKADEKKGGAVRARGLMEAFRNTLEFCSLADLGAKGPKFTWNNGREDVEFMQERLDQVVANASWCVEYSEVSVSVEANLSSDHAPIIWSLHGATRRRQIRRPFKYEAHWALHKECKAIIRNVWQVKAYKGSRWQLLFQRLKTCKEELTLWNNNTLK